MAVTEDPKESRTKERNPGISANEGSSPVGQAMSLIDLQEFLSKELSEVGQQHDFSKSFTPVSDALGFEVVGSLPPQPPKPTKPDLDTLIRESIAMNPVSPPKAIAAGGATSALSISQVLGQPPATATLADLKSNLGYEPPPPVPPVTTGRRIFSWCLDQGFVLALFALGVVITSSLLMPGQGEVWEKLVQDFSKPGFVRACIVEFCAIWLSYLLVGFTVFHSTFGMWVWGVRVRYGDSMAKEGKYIYKLARVWFSFLFYAPILPSFILLFRRKGRNLLDLLSYSSLYRTPN